MGCCNNKKECTNKQPVEIETAEFLSLETGTVIIDKLLTVATTGVCNFFFRDAKLNELVSRINVLFLENEYLKKLARLLPVQPAIDVAKTSVTINFGPDGEYALSIPVHSKEDRARLADQLFYAALELKRQEVENDKRQQFLFPDVK